MIKKIKKKNGVALFLVLVVLYLLSVLTYDLVGTGRVEVQLSMNARDRSQAYFLARSASKLSVLRLYLYMQAKNMIENFSCTSTSGTPALPDQFAGFVSQIDQIWSMALPELPLPGMDVDWPGKISATIEAEGSKIPINLLDGDDNRGSSQKIQDEIKVQLVDLINGLMEKEEFEKEHRGLDAEYTVNKLIDWLDADSDALEGGHEDRDYEDLDPPYKARNDRMNTLTDLYMVAGWGDSLFAALSPYMSLLKSDINVNPNTISLKRLQSIDPELSIEDLTELAQHRILSPFDSMDELEVYIQTELKSGYRFVMPDSLKQNSSNEENTFYINASGSVNNAVRTIRLGVKIERQKAIKKATTSPAPQPPSSGSSPGQGQSTGGTQQSTSKKNCQCGQSGKDLCKLVFTRVITVEEKL